MPLETGESKKSFSHNVATEMNAGKPQKQAVAIAYAQQRAHDAIDEANLQQRMKRDAEKTEWQARWEKNFESKLRSHQNPLRNQPIDERDRDEFFRKGMNPSQAVEAFLDRRMKKNSFGHYIDKNGLHIDINGKRVDAETLNDAEMCKSLADSAEALAKRFDAFSPTGLSEFVGQPVEMKDADPKQKVIELRTYINNLKQTLQGATSSGSLTDVARKSLTSRIETAEQQLAKLLNK